MIHLRVNKNAPGPASRVAHFGLSSAGQGLPSLLHHRIGQAIADKGSIRIWLPVVNHYCHLSARRYNANKEVDVMTNGSHNDNYDSQENQPRSGEPITEHDQAASRNPRPIEEIGRQQQPAIELGAQNDSGPCPGSGWILATRWKQVTVDDIKKAARRREGYKCADCGMTNEDHINFYDRQLDVHRLVPGSEYTIDGCVTVCKKCHGKRHRKINASGWQRPASSPLGRRYIGVHLEPIMWEALQELLTTTRRSISTEVTIALEHYFAKFKLWPPGRS